MEEFYRLNHPVFSCSNIDVVVHDQLEKVTNTATTFTFHGPDEDGNMLRFETEAFGTGMSDLIKAQIANHPRYPDVVAAYIECQKVGAPPETAFVLEEISRENHPQSCPIEIGADPELDEFMESYCEILHRYKEELSKPFNEAKTFLSNIESQLSNLCKGTLTKTVDYRSDDDHEGECGTSEEELMMSNSTSGDHEEEQQVVESELILNETYCGGGDGGGELGGEHVVELKEMLLRKYSGYLTTLRKDFLKKRKKGKLPKDARSALLEWWNTHLTWPYPTEEEKVKLSEMTGLDQKQINNWFINQRKRHWKPTEEMRFALIEGTGQ